MNDKEISITFTGHRNISFDKYNELTERLKVAIIKAYDAGYRIFYNGLAYGFDLMAAEVLLSIREKYPDIKLIGIIASGDQEAKWNERNKQRYYDVINRADKVQVLSETYYTGCYLRRDDYMLEHSNAVIAFFNGKRKGGTFHTVNTAEKMNYQIENIFF